MSIPDNLIIDYFELVTDVSDEEIAGFKKGMESDNVNPMDYKKRLGLEIVKQFYDEKAATDAQANFEKIFQKRDVPDADQMVKLGSEGMLTAELARVGLTRSRGEARRLLEQGGIEIDGVKAIEDLDMGSIKNGAVIKVGKRRFASK
jgi:tyrosyl-tRNA synthetase